MKRRTEAPRRKMCPRDVVRLEEAALVEGFIALIRFKLTDYTMIVIKK